MDVILFEKDESIAVLTLNLPDKLNAVSAQMRDLLYEYLLFIKADPSIKGVVITGNGRGFCAGADLSEFGKKPSIVEKRRIRLQHDLWEEIRSLDKPIAVAMHGFAIGSGIELAMLCDFRFAAPKTKIALPEVSIGVLAAAGGTQSLPRLMRHGLALDFALKGYHITAEEGIKRGIVTAIYPADTLLADTISFMKQVTKHAQVANMTKRLIAEHADYAIEQGLAVEQGLVNRFWQERRRHQDLSSC